MLWLWFLVGCWIEVERSVDTYSSVANQIAARATSLLAEESWLSLSPCSLYTEMRVPQFFLGANFCSVTPNDLVGCH